MSDSKQSTSGKDDLLDFLTSPSKDPPVPTKPKPASGKLKLKTKSPTKTSETLAGTDTSLPPPDSPQVSLTPAEKAKPAPKKSSPLITNTVMSSLIADSVTVLRDSTGETSVFSTSGNAAAFSGLRLPLVLQILLHCNILPFGYVLQCNGEEGTNKSTFMLWLIRLFYEYRGLAYMADIERKISPSQITGVLGLPQELEYPCLVRVVCNTTEEWQSSLNSANTLMRKRMDVGEKEKNRVILSPTGRRFPVLFCLDSLGAAIATERRDSVDRTGHGGRGFAIEALYNKSWFQTFVGSMKGYPFLFAFVNQLTKRKNERQMIERKTQGGKYVKFQEAIELEMTKITRIKDRSQGGTSGAEIGGNVIKFYAVKNALGPDKRSIRVAVRWFNEISEVQAAPVQRIFWDWDAAIVDAVFSDDIPAASTAAKYLGLQKTTQKKRVLYYSPTLGVSDKAAMSKTDIGRLISETPEVVDRLREIYDVQVYDEYQYGEDYYSGLVTRLREAEKDLFSEAKKARRGPAKKPKTRPK